MLVRGQAMFEQLGRISVFPFIANEGRVVAAPAQRDEQEADAQACPARARARVAQSGDGPISGSKTQKAKRPNNSHSEMVSENYAPGQLVFSETLWAA